MKKLILILACLSFGFAAFAQDNSFSEFELEVARDEQKQDTHTISVPDGFVDFQGKQYMSKEFLDAGGTITIEYSPVYGEVRLYYTCLMSQFDRGVAMNTVLEVFQDFLVLSKFTNADGKEFAKERYYHYTYLTPDKEKYFRDGKLRKAQYYSYVKFTK